MNKSNIPEPDLDNLLRRTLKDDIPSEAETRMNRQFQSLKGRLDRAVTLPEPNGWPWMRGPFRKEILAATAAAMIVLGLVMQFSAPKTALAHSLEQLKVIVTISMSLNRAIFMDCAILKPEAEGEQTSYRIRWRADGDARVDLNSSGGAQTIWISDETISLAGPVWQPALEFMSPEIVAKHIKEHYGLMQSFGRASAGTNEFLIAGREGRHDVEITVDTKTYLPKLIKKYSHNSGRTNEARNCILEARFLWNLPVPTELSSPQTPAAERSVNP